MTDAAPPTNVDPPAAPRPPRGRTGLLPLLLIVAVVSLTFAPIARHPFVAWDDDFTLQLNPHMQHPSAGTLATYWRHSFMDLYVPVTYTAWTALAFIAHAIGQPGADGSPDPRVFHVASILLHAFNASLVYLILRRLVKTAWPAAGGALLFGLHPIQVEAVAWASGLKDVLSATFSLIAILQYVIAVQPTADPQTGATEARRWWRYAAALVAMLLAMLAKPGAMVLPLMLAVIDGLILGRPWRRVLRSVAPFCLLAVPCVVWTKLCQPSDYLRYVPLWKRPIVAADALAFYLYKLLIPTNLAFDYGRSPFAIFEKHWARFTWLAPAAVTAALVVFRRRATPMAAAALILVIGVAPVLGLTTFDFEMISTVADHYLYLAMFGPALAAAWLLARWAARTSPASRTRPAVVCGIILGLLAIRAADQTRHWRDSRALFGRALAVNPESWSSWFGLGYINHSEGSHLLAHAIEASKAGVDPTPERLEGAAMLADAMECYRRTVSLSDYNVAAHHGYGAMLMYFGRYREAADEFRQVVGRRNHLRPIVRAKYYDDTDLLGQCLMASGQTEEGVWAFRAAVRLQPPPADAMAHLRAALAIAAAQQKASTLPQVTDTHTEATQGPIDPH